MSTRNIQPLAYSVDEACARIGGRIGRTKLYSEIAAGLLETIQIGDRRLITEAAIQKYLELKRRQSAA